MNKQQAVDTLQARFAEICRRTDTDQALAAGWLAALQEHAPGGVMRFTEQIGGIDFNVERPYLLMEVPTTTDTRIGALKSKGQSAELGKPHQIHQRQRQYSADDLAALKTLGWTVEILE